MEKYFKRAKGLSILPLHCPIFGQCILDIPGRSATPTDIACSVFAGVANATWAWDFVGWVLAVCHIPLILVSRWLWLNIQYGREIRCRVVGGGGTPANVKGPDGSMHLIARRTRAQHFNIAIDIEMLLSHCILHRGTLHSKTFHYQLVRQAGALGIRNTCLLIGV